MSSVENRTFTNSPTPLVVKDWDYQHLLPVIRASNLELAEALEEELSRADIVPDADLPDDAVALNATVTFRDLDTGADPTVPLVLPEAADMNMKKISVLSPIGVALLGLRTGGCIQWPMPNGKQRRIQILSVTQG